MNTILLAAVLLGQFDPFSHDPRRERAGREAAKAAIGETADNCAFVEEYAPESVAMIRTCSPEIARKLAALFEHDAKTAGVANPHGVLAAIAKPENGNDCARWLIENYALLTDQDAAAAWIARPLDYSLKLRSLPDDAAQVKARRLNLQAAISPQGWQMPDRGTLIVCGVCAVLAVAILFKRRRPGNGAMAGRVVP